MLDRWLFQLKDREPGEVPLVMRRIAARRERVNNSLDTSAALSRYGFHFEEVAKTVGVNFTHQAPTLDHRLDHIMPQVASMGAAVSVVDFNRDGWLIFT